MSFRKYKANRKVLIWLFKKYKGKCFYCGCSTVLPVSGYQGRQPLNVATIEHVYNNFSLIRLVIGKWSKTKLACWQCNHKKGEEDVNNFYQNGLYDYRLTHDGLLISLLKNENIH